MSVDGSKENRPAVVNIVKCRDDQHPVFLESQAVSTAGAPQFKLSGILGCSWAKAGDVFGPERLRPRIEPWLTALCQSEHFSLLLGSGLTHAIHRLGAGGALPGMRSGDFGTNAALINAEATRSAKAAGRGEGNVEDQIRIAGELLRGLELLGSTDDKVKSRAATLRDSLATVLADFVHSILDGERNLRDAPEEQRTHAFNYLVSFLMSFASRAGTRDRLNVFTTNYDRFIEAGAEVAGLHLLDRFVGSLAPIFRSSRLDLDMHYNPPGIRGEPRYLEGVARFTKLHGSLDWIESGRDIRRMAVPFGAREMTSFLMLDGKGVEDALRVMIYPNAAKDRETAFYPYVELFRDLAAAACRPNHTLICFGYSFGDEHINRIIEDMLTIPYSSAIHKHHSNKKLEMPCFLG